MSGRKTGRLRGRIDRVLCAIAAAGLALNGAAAGVRETRIECDLVGQKGEHYGYTFVFDHEKGTLQWIEGDETLTIERHTPTELLASRRGRFGASAANMAFFDLSLFSGVAAMTYLHDPTPAEVEQCERQQSSGCRDPIDLPQYAERGSCTLSERGGD
jgi:hypothetical protein